MELLNERSPSIGSEFFRSIFEHAAVGIALIETHSGRFVQINGKYSQLIGYSNDEMRQKTFTQISYPGDLVEDLDKMRQLHAGGLREFTMEKRLIRADGTTFWCHLTVSAAWEPGEVPRFHIAVVKDISLRKGVEQNLERARFALESAAEAIFTINADGRFVDVNQTACERLGYSRDELLALSVADINPHYPIEAWPGHWEELRQKHNLSFQSEHRTKDGRVFPVEISKSFFESGTSQYAFAFVCDLTSRKQSDAEIARFKEILEATPDLVGIADKTGNAWYINPAGRQLLGIGDDEDIRGTMISKFHSPEAAELVSTQAIPKAIQAASWEGENTVRHRNGTDIPVLQVVLAHKNATGEVEYLSTIARDTSERMRQEEQLQQQQRTLNHVSRLKTMGEMVAGIAHEINQPLAAIANFAQACTNALERPQPPLPENLKRWAEQITAQALRCGEIIRRLRGFATKASADRSEVKINEVVQESISLAGLDARPGYIKIVCRLSEPSPSVQGNPVELQQVLVNLLRNACEAMSGVSPDEQRIIIRSRTSTDHVQLDIEDSGAGLDVQSAKAVFDPFYTTKPDGMGMGLAISRSIVENYEGRLWAEPGHPRGAAFHIRLPITREVREP